MCIGMCIYVHTHTHTPHIQSPYITDDDITSTEEIVQSKDGFRGVDVLLTSEWPRGVDTHTQPPKQLDMSCTGSEAIARLAMAVRPRYHFAGSMHRFYERTPYRYTCTVEQQPEENQPKSLLAEGCSYPCQQYTRAWDFVVFLLACSSS